MENVFQNWDDDEGAWDITWIHEIVDTKGNLRIGITPDEKFFLLQKNEKSVKVSIDRLMDIFGNDIKREALFKMEQLEARNLN
jgi:hypothetical protein